MPGIRIANVAPHEAHEPARAPAPNEAAPARVVAPTGSATKRTGARVLVTPARDSFPKVIAALRADAALPLEQVGAHAQVLAHYADRLTALTKRRK